jgi:pimeloyl-ACP methyl ester carboxylesterase
VKADRKEQSMALVVLVHGAFGTPAELAPVEPSLHQAGHDVVIVDLPCTDPDASLSDYAAAVIAALGPPERDRETVVVGHSFGGATIGLVRERRPDVALVYVAAVVLEPGQSLLELLLGADPFYDPDHGDPWEGFEGLIVDAAPGLCRFDLDVMVAAVPEDEREGFRAVMEATQREQGVAPLREGWPGSSLPSGRVSYVLTTRDTMIEPELQRSMATAVGAAVHEIATDHEVFLEAPGDLGAILADIASKSPHSG